MSQPKSNLESSPQEVEALRRQLEEKIALIQEIRRELVHAQLTILELNDTVLEKETEKTDTTALLRQLEQLLEERINHIRELDRGLNEKITTLQQKFDTANREISAAHALAANLAQDLAQTRLELAGTRDTLGTTEEARRALAGKVAAMQASYSWRLTAPLRALRRLFS